MSQAPVVMTSSPLCILLLNCKLNSTLSSLGCLCQVYCDSNRTANTSDVALGLLVSRNTRQTNLGLGMLVIEPRGSSYAWQMLQDLTASPNLTFTLFLDNFTQVLCLNLNLLCNQGCLWTCDVPASACWVLSLQGRANRHGVKLDFIFYEQLNLLCWVTARKNETRQLRDKSSYASWWVPFLPQDF